MTDACVCCDERYPFGKQEARSAECCHLERAGWVRVAGGWLCPACGEAYEAERRKEEAYAQALEDLQWQELAEEEERARRRRAEGIG
jgi:hypothetical protein